LATNAALSLWESTKFVSLIGSKPFIQSIVQLVALFHLVKPLTPAQPISLVAPASGRA
jgi:hypothetical protein